MVIVLCMSPQSHLSFFTFWQSVTSVRVFFVHFSDTSPVLELALRFSSSRVVVSSTKDTRTISTMVTKLDDGFLDGSSC